MEFASDAGEDWKALHQVICNRKLHDFSKYNDVMLDRCWLDFCVVQLFNKLADLGVGDRVNWLLVELFQYVLAVAVVVGFVRGAC